MQNKISYRISITPASHELPIEGPSPLIISILNIDKDTATIFGNEDDFLTVEIQAPIGWILKERKKFQVLNGIFPEFTLAPGQTITETIYLHDFFTTMQPGKVELPVTVSFLEERHSVRKLIDYTEPCHFKIMEKQEKKFKERIDSIHREILLTKDSNKKLRLYKTVANIEHPQLVTIFIEVLLNDNMLVFHHTARKRLIDLTEKYGNREEIVRYLEKHGSRSDSYFFQLWKEKGIKLSDAEIGRLAQSASLWTRVFCLGNFPGPYNRAGIIESLKTEIQELQEKIKKLK